jgi:hypothetical protein
MTMGPLPVVLAAETGRLDSMSRLNFGKIYTVEHNVRIMPIGEIAPDAMEIFMHYAQEVTGLF